MVDPAGWGINNGFVHLFLRRQEYPGTMHHDRCAHNNDQPDLISHLCSRSPVHRNCQSECETLHRGHGVDAKRVFGALGPKMNLPTSVELLSSVYWILP